MQDLLAQLGCASTYLLLQNLQSLEPIVHLQLRAKQWNAPSQEQSFASRLPAPDTDVGSARALCDLRELLFKYRFPHEPAINHLTGLNTFQVAAGIFTAFRDTLLSHVEAQAAVIVQNIGGELLAASWPPPSPATMAAAAGELLCGYKSSAATPKVAFIEASPVRRCGDQVICESDIKEMISLLKSSATWLPEKWACLMKTSPCAPQQVAPSTAPAAREVKQSANATRPTGQSISIADRKAATGRAAVDAAHPTGLRSLQACLANAAPYLDPGMGEALMQAAEADVPASESGSELVRLHTGLELNIEGPAAASQAAFIRLAAAKVKFAMDQLPAAEASNSRSADAEAAAAAVAAAHTADEAAATQMPEAEAKQESKSRRQQQAAAKEASAAKKMDAQSPAKAVDGACRKEIDPVTAAQRADAAAAALMLQLDQEEESKKHRGLMRQEKKAAAKKARAQKGKATLAGTGEASRQHTL